MILRRLRERNFFVFRGFFRLRRVQGGAIRGAARNDLFAGLSATFSGPFVSIVMGNRYESWVNLIQFRKGSSRIGRIRHFGCAILFRIAQGVSGCGIMVILGRVRLISRL